MLTYCLSVTVNMKKYSLSVICFIAKRLACFEFHNSFYNMAHATENPKAVHTVNLLDQKENPDNQ